MMNHILEQIKNKQAQEMQFRLNYRTLFKKNNEWLEYDNQILGIQDWEDLKDICLSDSDKITLETKGFVKGIFQSSNDRWQFSFTEWNMCSKAYFNLIGQEIVQPAMPYLAYWDALKKKKGLHIISGERGHGKSTLIEQIIRDSRRDSPELIALHSSSFELFLHHDSVVPLGAEVVSWETHHPIYDGIDAIALDDNQVINWAKWIRFAEEGRATYITISAPSIENVLLQAKSAMEGSEHLWFRFCSQLATVINQKILSADMALAQEVWILSPHEQKELMHTKTISLQNLITDKSVYQSCNQSLIQNLVRRRIDVKTAFLYSSDPVSLDFDLKKMGL